MDDESRPESESREETDLEDDLLWTERTRWEELQKIRHYPLLMSRKRELLNNLMSKPVLTLKGFSRFRWKMALFHLRLKRRWRYMKRTYGLWGRPLRNIEVKCGSSITNVFFFLRWTMIFNLGLFIIILSVLMLPYFISRTENQPEEEPCPSVSFKQNDTKGNGNLTLEQLGTCCVDYYYTDRFNQNRATDTGFFRSIYKLFGNAKAHPLTPLYYGFYQAHTIYSPSHYEFSLAYCIVPVVIFLVSLLLMMRQIGVAVRSLTVTREGEFYKYSNLVFCGWDHYTGEEASANYKRKMLVHEMRNAVNVARKKARSYELTRTQKLRKWGIRVWAFLIVFSVQGLIGMGIYYASDYAIRYEDRFKSEKSKENRFPRMIVGLFPSITIALAALMFPFVLRQVTKMEQYAPNIKVTVNLIRSLIVRLLGIGFAALRFYQARYCEPKDHTCWDCKVQDKDGAQKDGAACWESQFGEQLYKIVLTELAVKFVLAFIVGYGRLMLGRHLPGPVFKSIGNMKFNLVKHSLDVIYIQFISWLGFYFAPALPLVASMYCFCLFYTKKFNVLVNCRAVPDAHRTTRSTTSFLATKMISFILASLIVGYVLAYLHPSRECGPFRHNEYSWEPLSIRYNTTIKTHPRLQYLRFLGSPGVTIPVAITLIFFTIYYYNVAVSNRGLAISLKKVLKAESFDQQYLSNKLKELKEKQARRKLVHVVEDVTKE